MRLKLFQVDAFTDRLFKGNPAAVVPLAEWPETKLLQQIAAENNLSETAFFVKRSDIFELRWFTPTVEIDLCGHATLAAAWVLQTELGESANPLRFSTRSGELRVSASGEFLTLDFPSRTPISCAAPEALAAALGLTRGEVLAAEVLEAEDLIVVLKCESDVKRITPNFTAMRELPLRGVVVTAPGDAVDFVSRWFGPKVGVDEDPVTGSAHTSLTPYWAARTGKARLDARQISDRGGSLVCELVGDRVRLSGAAVTYLRGEITV